MKSPLIPKQGGDRFARSLCSSFVLRCIILIAIAVGFITWQSNTLNNYNQQLFEMVKNINDNIIADQSPISDFTDIWEERGHFQTANPELSDVSKRLIVDAIKEAITEPSLLNVSGATKEIIVSTIRHTIRESLSNIKSLTVESDSLTAKGAVEIKSLPWKPKLNASDILAIIQEQNELQTILNEDRFEPLQSDSYIILVQVHDRIHYLKFLISSFAKVTNISKALIIFSHDVYDEEINRIIRSITFCKVMQIFFPFSIQTHEDKFPGYDRNDCPQDISENDSNIRTCHYRDAKKSLIKHHWWWKANRVFDELRITRNHTGLLLLMEADYYMADEALHMLKLMENAAAASCPQCDIFTVGGKPIDLNDYQKLDSTAARVSMWKDNLGFAFNRTTWHKIAKCAKHFCSYNDYNWDFTLQFVAQKCLQSNEKIYQIALERPRVFHIGLCGFHIHSADCDPHKLVANIDRELKKANNLKQTYPSDVKIIQRSPFYPRNMGTGYGDWSDIRDQELCYNMTTILRSR